MPVPESEQLVPEPLLTELLGTLDGWQREGQVITKTFTRKGWTSAVSFVDRVAAAAVAADHHPDLHIERYKHVRVVLTTHVSKGISRADIDLAKEIDRIALT